MDWSNERYVRVYTRDTTTWKLMDWRGRVVLSLLFRKVDRAGVLDVGHDGVLGLAAVLELPLDLVEAGLAQLTTSRGGMPTVVDTGTAYVIPNFVEAQEAPQSDQQRKRESRSRRREIALAGSRNLLLAAGSDPTGHETSRGRDEIGDEVTPSLPDPFPSRSELTLPGAIPPTAVPEPVPAAPRVPEPKLDQIVHSAPGLAHRPTTRPLDERARAEPTLDQLWSELELARQRAAIAAGVTLGPLLAHDPGRHDLAELLAEAARVGRRAGLVAQVRHAIAVAEAEARAKPDQLQWLSGAIFAPRNFRRLAAAPLPKSRAGPRSAPRDPSPPPKELPAGERAGPEQFAESRALLAALTSNPDDTPDEKPRRKAAK